MPSSKNRNASSGNQDTLSVEKFFSLEKDWDYAPHIGESLGHHAIRARELDLLVDFLYRRAEGALLISGKRGVGKTSTVFSAINKALENQINSNTERKILAVLVNAPSFDIRKKITDGGTHIDNNSGSSVPRNPNEKNQLNSVEEIDLLQFKRIVLQNFVRRLYK
jgi:Cdc6-like AAA superfamily ATPase